MIANNFEINKSNFILLISLEIYNDLDLDMIFIMIFIHQTMILSLMH